MGHWTRCLSNIVVWRQRDGSSTLTVWIESWWYPQCLDDIIRAVVLIAAIWWCCRKSPGSSVGSERQKKKNWKENFRAVSIKAFSTSVWKYINNRAFYNKFYRWVKFIYGIMCYEPYWSSARYSNVAVGFRLLGDSFPSRSSFPINPLLILLPCQAFIFFNLHLCFGLLFFSPVEANGNLPRDLYMQSLWLIVCRHFM